MKEEKNFGLFLLNGDINYTKHSQFPLFKDLGKPETNELLKCCKLRVAIVKPLLFGTESVTVECANNLLMANNLIRFYSCFVFMIPTRMCIINYFLDSAL